MNLKQKNQVWKSFLSNGNLSRDILESEANHLEAFLQNFVGYNFLQISPLDADLLFNAPKIKNTYFLASEFNANLSKKNVICQATALPFADESLDLVLLHHYLEWQEMPHNVLKEAVRVLHPKGYLLLATFRPISLWRFNKTYKSSVENNLTQTKLNDWLEFLDMEIVNTKHIFSRFLTNKNYIFNSSKKLDYLLEKYGVNLFATISLNWAQKKIGYPRLEKLQKKSPVWYKGLNISNAKNNL